MLATMKEFNTVENIIGPLILVKGVEEIGYGEIAEIKMIDGTIRRGKVLETQEDTVLVQVFEGTSGLEPGTTKVRFTGKGLEIGLSPDMVGRVFDGFGRPI